MKALISLVIFAASLNATAAVVKVDCKFTDYQFLAASIESFEVTDGGNLKNEVISVLQQEMGPTCKRLVNTTLRMGIPGRHTSEYELVTGHVVYSVVVGRQVEQKPMQWVSITKTQATR